MVNTRSWNHQGSGAFLDKNLSQNSPALVLAQREMEKGRSSLLLIPRLRGGNFQGVGYIPSACQEKCVGSADSIFEGRFIGGAIVAATHNVVISGLNGVRQLWD